MGREIILNVKAKKAVYFGAMYHFEILEPKIPNMKKKHAFLIWIAVLAAGPVCSQVNVAVKAGLNIASIKLEGTDTGPVIGIHGGLLANVTLTSRFFLRPEFLYSTKGWAFTQAPDGSMKLYYLNLPVLAGFNASDRISFLAGPELGYLLKSVRKPSISGSTPAYEKVDYAFSVGSAFAVTTVFDFELRYTHGFGTLIKATLRDQNNAPTAEVRDGSNRTLQFSIIYSF